MLFHWKFCLTTSCFIGNKQCFVQQKAKRLGCEAGEVRSDGRWGPKTVMVRWAYRAVGLNLRVVKTAWSWPKFCCFFFFFAFFFHVPFFATTWRKCEDVKNEEILQGPRSYGMGQAASSMSGPRKKWSRGRCSTQGTAQVMRNFIKLKLQPLRKNEDS